MDQLRTALNWLQRYHFWVLSVVVAAVAVVCWYSAAGALSKKFQTNQVTIKREFDNQARLRSEEFHANEQIIRRQSDEIQKQADSVARTWQVLYDRQREEVLKWPQELDEGFRRYVERLKFGDNIPGGLRERYFNYIERHFPELPKKVRARVLAEGERGTRSGIRGSRNTPYEAGGRLGDEGEAQAAGEDHNYLVEWLDQDDVRQQLYWAERPSALQIWVAQENLWVYHTLLQIIADTNEAVGADRPSNAAVRVIESLEVGQPAAQASNTSGRIMRLEMSTSSRTTEAGIESYAPPGESAGRGYLEFGGDAYSLGGSGTARGEASDAEERAQLLSYRYLNENRQPIVVTGASSGPNELGIEYKRLPVRMVLEMDQRALPILISACANQPLQVEVQQVRINPSARDVGSGRDSYAPSTSGSHSADAQSFDPQPNIATVIIHGIIYIINEPDTSTLQVAER